MKSIHPTTCPHCGRKLVFGVWRHILECAERKQKELDREARDKNL